MPLYTENPGDEFQFTRPRGARPATPPSSSSRTSFNSRAREGRDFRARENFFVFPVVSIHAPARGATGAEMGEAGAIAFQFTRPRGARPSRYAKRILRRVSIHAPARGATLANCSGEPLRQVSIHAPARGATRYLIALRFLPRFQFTRPRGARQTPPGNWSSPYSFNSRAREGRDRETWGFYPGSLVSIHAPARGATFSGQDYWALEPFQFTRPRGARRRSVALYGSCSLFQFTRPRGARHHSDGVCSI